MTIAIYRLLVWLTAYTAVGYFFFELNQAQLLRSSLGFAAGWLSCYVLFPSRRSS